MTPAPRKAAPIPVDVLALAERFGADITCQNAITAAIMQDRSDRASQEKRIRESERDRIVAYLREFAKRVEPKSASANNFNAAADAIESGHAFPAARAALGDKGAK